MKRLCGIDEAGRGPLAGPVCVAGVIFKEQAYLQKEFSRLNDSKKITQKIRESLFEFIKDNAHYHIVMKSNKQIDSFGITYCIKEAIIEILEHLDADRYLMDGNSSFGINALEHLIKADTMIKEVSAASILAKVTRDAYMDRIDHLYPRYLFAQHKGYGTQLHRDLIKKYGKSELHRLTYKIKGIDD